MSIRMPSVMYLHFSKQEEEILEHTNAKVICIHFSQLCRPLCNIGIHLVTLLSILI